MGTSQLKIPIVSTNKSLYEIRHNQLYKIVDFPIASNASAQSSLRARSHYYRCQARILENKNGVFFVPGVGFIYVYDQKSQQVKSTPIEKLDLPWGMVQANDYAYSVTGNNLIRIDEQGRTTTIFKNDYFLLSHLLLMDRSGVLWAATANATGIRQLNLRPKNFHSQRYSNCFVHDALDPWLHNPMNNMIGQGSYETRCAKDQQGNIWAISNLSAIKKISGWPTLVWPGSGAYRLADSFSSRLPFNKPGWKISNITLMQTISVG